MKVWRLEDEHTHGAFKASHDSFTNFLIMRAWALSPWRDDDVESIPLPEDDGIDPWATAGWRYGVASPDQLFSWFGPDATPFALMGVCVNVYDVPAPFVAVGGHQVAFDPRYALLVEHHEVSEFWAAHAGVTA